ncbi:YraN family protein [Oceaniglobus ichthyenteri]|uniref:YraN family protein n=1 Tax=Oceaniglobus ichthyenteri TaxID=2136177 RepID=UPI000D354136|nr:YraN family protein [Oceaniglobus ichthyenteri]
MSGQVSYHAGRCAEDAVAAEYERRGHRIVGRRWRGKGGEIDLIAQGHGGFVFIEVKASRTHHRAALRIGRQQMQRIFDAATEFVANEPDGQLSEMRFDVALMDRAGTIDIIENAFM